MGGEDVREMDYGEQLMDVEAAHYRKNVQPGAGRDECRPAA
jgi:hypothetical protein